MVISLWTQVADCRECSGDDPVYSSMMQARVMHTERHNQVPLSSRQTSSCRLTGWQDCSCDRCGDPSRQKIQEDSIIESNKIKSNHIRGHCPKEFNPRNKTLWRSLKVSHFGYVHIHPLHWTFTSMAYWNGCKRWNMNEWIWNYAYGLGEGQLTLPLSGLLMTH